MSYSYHDIRTEKMQETVDINRSLGLYLCQPLANIYSYRYPIERDPRNYVHTQLYINFNILLGEAICVFNRTEYQDLLRNLFAENRSIVNKQGLNFKMFSKLYSKIKAQI